MALAQDYLSSRWPVIFPRRSIMDVKLDIVSTLAWSPWVGHLGCWRGDTIPDEPGVYRIRRVGQDCLDYIGQTGVGGMTLRKRLGMQRGVYAAEMPYTDPHTAAPALWAMRQAPG